nr:ATPase [Cryptococcus depauperatus CBS 7841]
MAPRDIGKAVVDVAFFAASQVALYYALRYVLSGFDPSSKSAKKAQDKAKHLLANAGLSKAQVEALGDLDEYESIMAAEIVPSSAIDVTFESIGGLDDIIASLRESVIYPLVFPELFGGGSKNGLLSAPKGVLLYGHPGCGKTMLAKALAKESGATFINLPLSSLTSKWFGESNKLVAGLFSLATKLQPSIIFIDEIDTLFRERSQSDHEVMTMMKAEFMTYFVGPTNMNHADYAYLRIIDSAILRRMPKRFAVKLPNLQQRIKILNLMLSHTQLAPGFSIEQLAIRTDGLSGSDLRETCRNAAMVPVRELMREKGNNGIAGLAEAQKEGFKVRPLNLNDFIAHDSHAYAHVDPSRKAPGYIVEPLD